MSETKAEVKAAEAAAEKKADAAAEKKEAAKATKATPRPFTDLCELCGNPVYHGQAFTSHGNGKVTHVPSCDEPKELNQSGSQKIVA